MNNQRPVFNAAAGAQIRAVALEKRKPVAGTAAWMRNARASSTGVHCMASSPFLRKGAEHPVFLLGKEKSSGNVFPGQGPTLSITRRKNGTSSHRSSRCAGNPHDQWSRLPASYQFDKAAYSGNKLSPA